MSPMNGTLHSECHLAKVDKHYHDAWLAKAVNKAAKVLSTFSVVFVFDNAQCLTVHHLTSSECSGTHELLDER